PGASPKERVTAAHAPGNRLFTTKTRPRHLVMPRYVCLLEEKAISAAYNMASPKVVSGHPDDPKPITVSCNRPVDFRLRSEPVPVGFIPAHEFEAADGADAQKYFRKMQDEGMPMDRSVVGNASQNTGDANKMWRFRGDVRYIKVRLPDFGLGDHNEK